MGKERRVPFIISTPTPTPTPITTTGRHPSPLPVDYTTSHRRSGPGDIPPPTPALLLLPLSLLHGGARRYGRRYNPVPPGPFATLSLPVQPVRITGGSGCGEPGPRWWWRRRANS